MRLLISVIHEMAFKTSTTYSFPCMIFQLCRDSRVPVWHCDVLRTPIGIVYIGIIRDETNVVAQRSWPRVDLPKLNENQADTIKLDQGVYTASFLCIYVVHDKFPSIY